MAAHGAGERGLPESCLAEVGEMRGYVCCPSLVDSWCILAIACKCSRRVLAGEGDARDVEGVR